MVSSVEPVLNTFLLLTNILNSVRIDKLQVPEVISSDCLEAILDCSYSGGADDVSVTWLLNGIQVYEWRSGVEPKASGILEGRLDMTYGLTGDDEKTRSLRIVELTPELTGEYTCVVRSQEQEVMETKSMTVYSPERDFELTISAPRDSNVIQINCVAKRLHPHPDLILEYNKVPIAQQQRRIWREGMFFDGECEATLSRRELLPGIELACRLQLPLVDYTAITKKYVHLDHYVNGAISITLSSYCIVGFIIILAKLNYR